VRKREFGGTGVQLPVIGQGTWTMGDKPGRETGEIRALRLGLDLGMTHIDTAEMYGDGRAEELVGKAIAGRREGVFLTSKVLPSNASYEGTIKACENSLRRLATNYVDLYLLHWWSERHPIGETMRALEQLAKDGKTRFIGVSNFDLDRLEQARNCCGRSLIACDQVCYHLRARGIEYDLIPHCSRSGVAIVGYSPYGSGNFPKPGSSEWKVLDCIGRRHNRTPRQVALNFLTRHEGVFTIPKSATEEHTRENAGASDWDLDEDDLKDLDAGFRPPKAKSPLAMI
jgi:diketogulonate reductase-like aldo/keto reductase